MEQLVSILKTVLPVITLLTLGYLCKRWRIFSQEGVNGIKALVITIMLPLVQFRAFSHALIGTATLFIALGVFIASLGGLLTGTLMRRLFRSSAFYERFLYTSFEVGMIGYALYIIAFGQDKLTNFATVALGQELFVFLILLPIMQASEGQKTTFRATALKIIKTPVLIGILAGLLVSSTGLGALLYNLPAGIVFDSILEFASAPTAALMLIVIGYSLDFKGMDPGFALRVSIGRILYMSAACFALVAALKIFFPLSEELVWAFVILFMLPPSYIVPFFVDSETAIEKSSTFLSIYTMLTIGVFLVSIIIKNTI